MDFKALRYAVAVAEHGGISSAAKALGISQPSLSKYLQNIADGLGVALFERAEGRLVPTYAGERYVALARQMLSIAQGLDNIGGRAAIKQLCITSPPFEGSYVHSFAIQRFCEEYPDVNLLMLESRETERLLASGEADIAITSTPLDRKEYVHTKITRDEILLVAARNHPLAKQAVWRDNCSFPWVDVNLLWGERLVHLFPDQRTRILSDELLAREGVTLRALMQTRSVLNAIRVAATGAAVCFAPALGMKQFGFTEPPAFFSVGKPLTMDIYCVYNRAVGNSGWAMRFLELVGDFLR